MFNIYQTELFNIKFIFFLAVFYFLVFLLINFGSHYKIEWYMSNIGHIFEKLAQIKQFSDA